MSFLGSFFQPVTSLVGGLIGNKMASNSAQSMQNMQFEQQKELAKMQNDFNVENYKHRHQWEVEDLRSAGLNPILSANSAGAVASAGLASAPSAPDTGKYKTDMVNSVIGAILKSRELDIMSRKADIDLKNADTNKLNADANMMNAHTNQNVGNSAISLNEANAEYLKHNTAYIDNKAKIETAVAKSHITYEQGILANTINRTKAEIEHWIRQDKASWLQASASEKQAIASNLLAQVAKENGVSQRMVNDANMAKLRSESRRIGIDSDIATFHNQSAVYGDHTADDFDNLSWFEERLKQIYNITNR